ncbi:MAG: hypothetical protein WD052_13745 [Bacteroidales bacterium]
MEQRNTIRKSMLLLMLICFFATLDVGASSETDDPVYIYCDQTGPAEDFAVKKLKGFLGLNGSRVEVQDLKGYKSSENRKITSYFLLNQQNPNYKSHSTLFTGNIDPSLMPEGFSIERSNSGITITGADDTGLLYGVYELIERFEMEDIHKITSFQSAPKLAFRGIKFNLPWSTYRVHESLSMHYETCRDLQFWEKFLDMMSENRFNHLTLWAIHPWTYMVKPTNYPEASGLTDRELLEWQNFWHSLFAMANERCIKVLMVNWNIFVSPEFAKAHNVALYSTELSSGYNGKGDYSTLVQEYNKDVVRQVLEEYPELSGLGISQNERMEGRTEEEWQNWIVDTYFNILNQAEGNKELMMRGHTHPSPELTRDAIEKNKEIFKGPVWISLKFNWSHAFASPKLFYIHGGSTSDSFWNPHPVDYKILFKIRNEDFFILRWGQPDYIRELIRENSQPYIDGYTIGSETYIPAKEYTTKPGEHLTWDYGFEKQWLFYKLWGRLMYDPEISDEVFELGFDKKYGPGTGKFLLGASAKAGNMPLRLATYFSSSWDFTLYSEGFISGATQTWRGQYYDKTSAFLSIEEIIHSKTLDPQWMNIREYVDMINNEYPIPASRLTPAKLARQLEDDGLEALSLLSSVAGTDATLLHEIADQKAWAYLSLYFASKLRAGIDLQLYRTSGIMENKESALSHIEQALIHWEKLCLTMDPYAKEIPLLHLGDDYITTKFSKPVERFSWRAFSDQVLRDVEIVRNSRN